MTQGKAAENKKRGKRGMRKQRLNDRDAQCPFFRKHFQTSIRCESPIPGSDLALHFGDAAAQETQFRVFCSSRFQNCEIYQATMGKYEDE